ncbi:hypothetical protein [Novipirellula rosea]|uniref:GATA-type domain-containing protein n=1 Tax=Novipirellula rosea TaxID=1031540 RepID=A0ABP8M6P4_9BACT
MTHHEPDFETPCDECNAVSYARWTQYYPRWSHQLCLDCATHRIREESALAQINDYRRVLDPCELARTVVYGIRSSHRDSDASSKQLQLLMSGIEVAVAGLIFQPEMIVEYQFLSELEMAIIAESSPPQDDDDSDDWWGGDTPMSPTPSNVATV